MFDLHCDLLTYIYINRNNKEKIQEICNSIYNEKNINGAIFNLFFMSKKEMQEELDIEEKEINVIEMLNLVNYIIKNNNIISNKVKYIYGIEGLDYLKNISDIDLLYNLGVRSVNIVWNNENKFGGGTRSENNVGLTNLGEELVEKLVKKNILIDLSHANEKTFFDIINKAKELKKLGYNPKIFASHSNSKSICNVKRNLTDKQILSIKEMNGIIGIVEYKDFICNNINNYEQYFLKHIYHIKNLLGSIENIAVSTDDEIYYNKKLENANLYSSSNVGIKLRELLLNNNFTIEDTNKILKENAINFFKL